MSDSNWKEPFLDLKKQLKILVDTGISLYHTNLMTPFHEREEACKILYLLEASVEGEEMVEMIETPTEGCHFHAHFFFGNSNGFNQLGRLLDNLHSWLHRVPKGLLPEFELPNLSSQIQKNVVIWANIMYFLAWDFDNWYLDAEVEVQDELNRVYFYPWNALNQPPEIDPCSILIHQKSSGGKFVELHSSFKEHACKVPEVIDAYLLDVGNNIIGEFLKASLAAIDVLVYMLEGRAKIKLDTLEDNTSGKNKSGKKTKHQERVMRNVFQLHALLMYHLHALLMYHHRPENNPESYNVPLTQDQMAEKLNWFFKKSGKPDQSRVRRCLVKLFGENGPEVYKNSFITGSVRKGFWKVLDSKNRELEVAIEDKSQNE